MLGACASDPEPPPVRIEPPDYAYLTPIPLNVAGIEVVDWSPPRRPPNVDHRAPIEPRAFLRRMAEDRLKPTGAGGNARFIIENASLIEERLRRAGGLTSMFTTEQSERYVLTLAVRLEVRTADGATGSAAASVVRSRTVSEDASTRDRELLWQRLIKEAIDDPQGMNVEFEFQVRNALRAFVGEGARSSGPVAPSGVEVQSLEAPAGGAAVQPAGTPRTLTPAPASTPPTGTLGTLPVPPGTPRP